MAEMEEEDGGGATMWSRAFLKKSTVEELIQTLVNTVIERTLTGGK